MMERYLLAKERVIEITQEEVLPAPYLDFFKKTAMFLKKTIDVMDAEECELSLDELQKQNYELYQDILPENYDCSYGNPEYAEKMLGEYGKVFTFLYAELFGTICYAYEKELWDLTVALELFLEVYGAFEADDIPTVKTVKEILRSYVNDYCHDMVERRIAKQVDPKEDFAVRIIMDSDLTDIRYLYKYGEYISSNEIGVAEYMNSLSQEQIEAMARTYTEGFRIGYINGRKDITKKKIVNIRFSLGFERMVKAAIHQFKELGLEPVIYRYATHAVDKKKQLRIGYLGAIPNLQFDYDHRLDCGLFMDSDFVQKKLRALQNGYEVYKDLAGVYAGPACIDTFGEVPFAPVSHKGIWELGEHQQKLLLELDNETGQITNRYVKRNEASFTIIAYPVPEIGENFREIFAEIVKINTLDYKQYERIQQTMIDVFNQYEWVEIKGSGENETDLLIHLKKPENPETEANFENCVADVNIPVGEIFTTPVLAGTGGVLHVSKVYLDGLLYKDLKLIFDCGQVIDYTCSNFDDEEENRKYVFENVLFSHRKLPMGEFAIGTNTTAYVAAKKYDIADKLPILIAEKMGPHFAVGDTCYSWSEDVPVFNPDGKEIIARDNEISELRKEDISIAYYNCHTDITIPYEELGSIRLIDDKGDMLSIIEDGRFVLPGTEELNKPLDK